MLEFFVNLPTIRYFVLIVLHKAEKAGHKNVHSYHMINKLNFPLLDKDWTAEEELLLVEGLERFGFGNWLDISEHLSSEKTKEEVEQHYEILYLNVPNFVPSK